jgi:tRNA(Ile)-lysidine synthase
MLSHPFAKAAQRLGIRSDVCSIVACSGGVDSMALAALMHDGGFDFRLLHVHYGLRGSDSKKEKELVESWAQTNGLSIRVFDAQKELSDALNKGENLQHAARRIRYRELRKEREAHAAGYILTAHHAQDRLEGLFISLIRGESWRSLCGMPDKTNEMARPLLGFTKEEIRSYARSAQVPFLEDRSNDSDAYLRNRIRNHIVPLVMAESPGWKEQLDRMQAELGALRQRDDESFARWKNDAVQALELEHFQLDRSLCSKHPYYFSRWIREYTGSLTLKAPSIPSSGSGQQLAFGSHRLQVERDHLLWISEAGEVLEELLQIKSEGKFICADQPWSVCRSTGSKAWQSRDKHKAVLDARQAPFPWTIRSWRKGDRFRPIGMKGSKLLSDYFIDRKFMQRQKEDMRIVTIGGQIAWLMGERVDARFAADARSEEVYVIEPVQE